MHLRATGALASGATLLVCSGGPDRPLPPTLDVLCKGAMLLPACCVFLTDALQLGLLLPAAAVPPCCPRFAAAAAAVCLAAGLGGSSAGCAGRLLGCAAALLLLAVRIMGAGPEPSRELKENIALRRSSHAERLSLGCSASCAQAGLDKAENGDLTPTYISCCSQAPHAAEKAARAAELPETYSSHMERPLRAICGYCQTAGRSETHRQPECC